eukprot:CAMPEP_0182590032 /NCGR_PEP_ID=MMETSP1324-20130603/70810_1 /TAXON_ID=236786 /ORGANISM="Florenciella sp., Strain RCC1587" /LENGTH=74 /DNA_ID=CAMNT_0024807223 /DNA_START=63 /DNA_END=283 /DNA_ORIENTATION=+
MTKTTGSSTGPNRSRPAGAGVVVGGRSRSAPKARVRPAPPTVEAVEEHWEDMADNLLARPYASGLGDDVVPRLT